MILPRGGPFGTWVARIDVTRREPPGLDVESTIEPMLSGARSGDCARVVIGVRSSSTAMFRSRRATSAARAGRSSGCVASISQRRSSSGTGASGNTSPSLGAGVVTSRARIAIGVGPMCGGRPAIISKSVAPRP